MIYYDMNIGKPIQKHLNICALPFGSTKLQNFYEILDVKTTADTNEIKAAYNKIMK